MRNCMESRLVFERCQWCENYFLIVLPPFNGEFTNLLFHSKMVEIANHRFNCAIRELHKKNIQKNKEVNNA